MPYYSVMDTKTSTSKLPPIRTYANDLAIMKERGSAPATQPKVSTPKADATKPEAAPEKKLEKVFSDPNPIKPRTFTRSKNTTPVAAVPSVSKDTPSLKPLPAKISANLKNSEIITTNSAGFVVDNEDAAAATVITDTKKDRFKLLPSIIESIKTWFTNKQTERARKKAPRYTVPETTHRKGVIQKATSTTAKTTTADFASIQKRILQRKQAEVKKSSSTTTWSANTETGFLLLEAPEISTPTNVTAVPRKSMYTPTEKSAPVVLSRTTTTVNVTPTKQVNPTPVIVSSQFADTAITEPVTTATITPEPVIEKAPAAPASTVTPIQTEEVAEENVSIETPVTPVEEPTDSPTVSEVEGEPIETKRLLSLNTNVLALGLSGIALALFAFAFYSYSLFDTAETKIVSVPKIQTVLGDSTLITLDPAPTTSNELQVNLSQLKSETTKLTEIAFVNNGVEIDPAVTMSLIDAKTEPGFAQTILKARLGYSSEQVPFVILSVSDPISARGSMLAIESRLASVFGTMFGESAAAGTSKFIDANIRGVDVRGLKNANGGEIIFYGLVDTTVIITTNSLTFASLVPLVTPK